MSSPPTSLQPPTSLAAGHTCELTDGLLTAYRIDLTWQRSSSAYAEGYRIWRATTAGGPYEQVGSVSGGDTDTFSDETLAASTTYYYVARTSAGAWISIDSNEDSATTKSLLCL